jgi:hypothetical protein
MGNRPVGLIPKVEEDLNRLHLDHHTIQLTGLDKGVKTSDDVRKRRTKHLRFLIEFYKYNLSHWTESYN